MLSNKYQFFKVVVRNINFEVRINKFLTFASKMSGHKIAIVTGANKGLGFELVKGLCKEYSGKVYLTSRDEKRGKAALEKLELMGCCPEYHELDITKADSINRIISHIRDNNLKVEVLINNAGVFFLKDAKEPMLYQAEHCVGVNFFFVVNFTEAIMPYVEKGGRIVNISSSSGHLSRIPSESLREKFRAENLSLDDLKDLMNKYIDDVRENKYEEKWGNSAYIVSKIGLNAYTFLLHRRLFHEKGIIVNCVHPGYLKTDMTHGAGTMQACDGAKVPLDLALRESEGGKYLWHNGTQVPWDGPDPRGFIDGML